MRTPHPGDDDFLKPDYRRPRNNPPWFVAWAPVLFLMALAALLVSGVHVGMWDRWLH